MRSQVCQELRRERETLSHQLLDLQEQLMSQVSTLCDPILPCIQFHLTTDVPRPTSTAVEQSVCLRSHTHAASISKHTYVQEQKMAEERGSRQNADTAKKNMEEQLAKMSVAYQVLIRALLHRTHATAGSCGKYQCKPWWLHYRASIEVSHYDVPFHNTILF